MGQPVQVQPRQQPTGLLGAALERRQQPALEALLEAAHPRAPQRDRPAAHAEPPRLAQAVVMPNRRIDGEPPLVAPAAQELIHFFFQHPLQEALYPLARERFDHLYYPPEKFRVSP